MDFKGMQTDFMLFKITLNLLPQRDEVTAGHLGDGGMNWTNWKEGVQCYERSKDWTKAFVQELDKVRLKPSSVTTLTSFVEIVQVLNLE